ncbi:MAG: GNAT family N-acetyltransferase, partial [Pseudomonadota bacterium]
MLKSFTATNKPPLHLREAYLNSLSEPQELYLEDLVQDGTVWCMQEQAYAICNDHQIVEFYVIPELAAQRIAIFDAARSASGANSALCKSFDTQFMSAALASNAQVEPVGLLFRHVADPTFTLRSDVQMRQGNAGDIAGIMSFNDDFFTSHREVTEYADGHGLFALEHQGSLIGCGIGKPVIAGCGDIDIGMLVHSAFRRLGYGAYIIAFLKHHYLQHDLRPICGCEINNLGSQKALRNAGFVDNHRILKIT